MSIKQEGLQGKSKDINVSIFVGKSEPLIKLSNLINWQEIYEIAFPDLIKTQKGFWWLGRSLYVRIHLGVMVLQSLMKFTDRGAEFSIKNTPIYQVFCGLGIVKKWKCPDHTKIEEFRNRIMPETHKKIGDYILQLAQEAGFADPSWVDIDSTVQESSMSYPSDASLMKKLAAKCHKVVEYMKSCGSLVKDFKEIDIKEISKTSKDYFFLAKNTAIEIKREVFANYHRLVKSELKETIEHIESLPEDIIETFDWNIKEHIRHIQKGWRYLLDVAHFIRNHTIKEGKLLCFYLESVACIKKGKIGKENEFGRVFQLGRIGGNFMVAYTSQDVMMNDKFHFINIIDEHESVFGEDTLKSVATDKGYYSKKNVEKIKERSIPVEGMQKPGKQIVGRTPLQEELKNRRAGVEPLIGHVKKFGLGKSRMRKDQTILASGYRSVMGFNLSQMLHYLE